MRKFLLAVLFLLINLVRSKSKQDKFDSLYNNQYYDDLTNRYMRNEKLSSGEYATVQEMLGALESELSSHHKLIPPRTKKFKATNEQSNEENDESQPLFNHQRKNYFNEEQNNEQDIDQLTQVSQTNKRKSCVAKMKAEPNVIIDSKKSIAKGAKLLNIDYISKSSASTRLNSLQESCTKICCDNSECDTALLSMKLGEDGYRCYQFKCSGQCQYVKHVDYVVLKLKSDEKSDLVVGDSLKTNSKQDLATGHKDSQLPCHKDYEFTCRNGKCIPIYDACNSFDDCDDKSDELSCNQTSSLTTVASTTRLVALSSSSQLDQDKDAASVANDMYKGHGDTLQSNKPDELVLEKLKKTSKNKNHKQKHKSSYNPLEYPESDVEPYEEDAEELANELAAEILKNQDDANFAENLSDDDYDEYRALKQQAKIVDHLKELENLKQFSNKKKIVQQSPDYFFDSFLKTPRYFSTTKPTLKTTTKQFQRPQINFHDGQHLEDKMMDQDYKQSENAKLFISNFSPEDKIYFTDKQKALRESSGITSAIVLLVIGVSLVVALFAYLILSTKYVKKRINWIKKIKEKKNVDVEADYLINGMYL